MFFLSQEASFEESERYFSKCYHLEGHRLNES